jgi:hypothetical protein
MRHRVQRLTRRAQVALLVPAMAVSSIALLTGSEAVVSARAGTSGRIAAVGAPPTGGFSPGPGWQVTQAPSATPTPSPSATPTATPIPTPIPTPTRVKPTAPPSLAARKPPPPAKSTAGGAGVSSGSSTAKPGPTSTGVPAGTALTPSDSLQITTPNQVIDGLDVNGSISVEAPGVVIKNSRIHGDGPYGVYVRSGSVTITDTEIFGFENGIAGDGWTATRVNLHSLTGDGAKLGSDVTLQDSWIHDLTPAAGAHADGGQMQEGVNNLVVRHNVIDLANVDTANSALFLAPDFGPNSDGPVTIDGNWLDGGNFTLYCVDGNNGQYVVRNITITSNRFGRGAQYGPADVNVPITQSGNVWADTGAGLDL